MPELSITQLPKSSSGRKARPLDQDFAKALAIAIKKSGGTPDANGNRPFFNTSDRFDTKGRASADGRRYADHVKSELGLERVSVRVYPDGKKFGWGLYLPLPSENGDSASE